MVAAAVVLAAAAVPAGHSDAIERLNAELLASSTATAVLERRCAALGLADPPRVRAEVERGRAPGSAAPSRFRLRVGKDEPLGYRRVRLMCGDAVLSEATNWYVPARLTPAMNAALDDSDAPFGRVILPLVPSRRTVSIRLAKGQGSAEIIRHRAIVLDGQGRPLAEVVERYQRVLIGAP
ncbi:hypothetical protein BFL28_03985 [Sphingomonas turrisvirgatae]|uniref:Uncharacterized protein n=1 Tax=Sphingomonas turrisvirgatae TaxID=1888892 RepID=A0A1E3LTB2_9SPHN|nr:hypothetical protein BFL28_03985 [Sphingomonas turrisvirgatae]